MFSFFFIGTQEPISWMAIILFGCQVVVAAVALLAAYIAWNELHGAAENRRQELKISQANFLLELDTRWDAPPTKEARLLMGSLIEQINILVTQGNPNLADGPKQEKIEAEWGKQLGLMREQKEDEYSKLLSLCGFFETVGLMVHREYISGEDVKELFKGPILSLETAFKLHLEERRNEIGVPEGLFEHAFRLCDLCRD